MPMIMTPAAPSALLYTILIIFLLENTQKPTAIA
jgi:hypothetical protein